MVVYVDVLIVINTVIDFFLLSLTAFMLKYNVRFLRRILAAFVSALFSLYIFLPPVGFILELLMRLSASVVAVLICFKFMNIRRYLRTLGVFYGVSFLYAGLMAALWMLFEPQKMSINNGVVYFNISPLVLLTVSFVIYIAVTVFKKLFKTEAVAAKRMQITLGFNGNTVKATAIADSGHTLNDAFGNSVVMFVDRKTSEALLGKLTTQTMLNLIPPESETLRRSFRVIPVKTVTNEGLMPAVKIDTAEIKLQDCMKSLDKPIVVLTEGSLGDYYSVILPLDIFEA